jgi:hypothetical protein
VGALAVAEFEQIDDEIVGGGHGVRIVLAENLFTASLIERRAAAYLS